MTPGATRSFPEGRCAPDDEGELNIGIGADKAANLIRLDFGQPTAWIAFPPDDARKFAVALLLKAMALDGQITTVEISGRRLG